MRPNFLIAAAVGVFSGAGLAQAKNPAPAGILEQIPLNVRAALVFRHIGHIDHMVRRTAIAVGHPISARDDLLAMIRRGTHLGAAIDGRRSAAVVLMDNGHPIISPVELETMVVALLPVTHPRQAMKKLAPNGGNGKIQMIAVNPWEREFFMARGQYLAIAPTRGSLVALRHGKGTLASGLSPLVKKMYAANDVLDYVPSGPTVRSIRAALKPVAGVPKPAKKPAIAGPPGGFGPARFGMPPKPISNIYARQALRAAERMLNNTHGVAYALRLNARGICFTTAVDMKKNDVWQGIAGKLRPLPANALAALPAGTMLLAGATQVSSGALAAVFKDAIGALEHGLPPNNQYFTHLRRYAARATAATTLMQRFNFALYFPKSPSATDAPALVEVTNSAHARKLAQLMLGTLSRPSVLGPSVTFLIPTADPMFMGRFAESHMDLIVQSVLTTFPLSFPLGILQGGEFVGLDQNIHFGGGDVRLGIVRAAKKIGAAGISFTKLWLVQRPPAAGKPIISSKKQIGAAPPKGIVNRVYIGATRQRVVTVVPGRDMPLARAAAGVSTGADPLDAQPEIKRQARYILPHAVAVFYLPVDRWVALFERMHAKTSTTVMPPNAVAIGSAPSPAVLSIAVDGTSIQMVMHAPMSLVTSVMESKLGP